MANPSSSSSSSSLPKPKPSNGNNNTTFVHVEPSVFKEVVQKLTGLAAVNGNICFKRPKLQERRGQPAKLEIPAAPAFCCSYKKYQHAFLSRSTDMVVVSPVSIMDSSFYLSSPSPTTPCTITITTNLEEKEEREIAEKGFYLYHSPKNYGEPPKLLPLFPIHSPQANKPTHRF